MTVTEEKATLASKLRQMRMRLQAKISELEGYGLSGAAAAVAASAGDPDDDEAWAARPAAVHVVSSDPQARAA